MNKISDRQPRGKWSLKPYVSGLLAGHSALGLVVAALAYLISLTGTIAVFGQELKLWEQPAAPEVRTVTDDAVQRALRAVLHRAPRRDDDVVTLTLPAPTYPRFIVRSSGHNGTDSQAWIADAKGVLAEPERHPTTDFIIALHARLLLPDTLGMALVGVVGIAMLALTISGVLAHPRIFKDAFRMRRGRGDHLQHADLHNRLGTWALPFHLLIAFTGSLLGIFLVIFLGVAASAYKGDVGKGVTDLIGPLPTQDQRAAPMPAIPPLIRISKGRSGATLAVIDVQRPGTRAERIGVTLRDAQQPLILKRTVFDGASRAVFANAGASLPQQAIMAAEPLHFGRFGGRWMKLIYGLLGFSLCAVISTGVRIWLIRRRSKGHPSPLWERLWLSVEWGQPIAIAIAAIGSLCGLNSSGADAAWGASSVLLLGCAILSVGSQSLEKALKLSTAILLTLIATAWGFAHGLAVTSEGALIVQLLLVTGALMIVRHAYYGKSLPLT